MAERKETSGWLQVGVVTQLDGTPFQMVLGRWECLREGRSSCHHISDSNQTHWNHSSNLRLSRTWGGKIPDQVRRHKFPISLSGNLQRRALCHYSKLYQSRRRHCIGWLHGCYLAWNFAHRTLALTVIPYFNPISATFTTLFRLLEASYICGLWRGTTIFIPFRRWICTPPERKTCVRVSIWIGLDLALS